MNAPGPAKKPPLQCTLAREAVVEGVGLHTGEHVRVKLKPAPANSGIVFVRADLPAEPRIAAAFEAVNPEALRRRTEMRGFNGATVATTEHLLGACLGMGIDNIEVVLDGPEIPILDGSALPFVKAMRDAHPVEQGVPRRTWWLKRPVAMVTEHGEVIAAPAERMTLTFFAPLVRAGMPTQSATLEVDRETFRQHVAPARTFVFEEDIAGLREAGLIRGGSLDCAIVIREGQPLHGDYRLHNELACHKLLDLMGDLAVLGRPVQALITARGTGHALHYRFIEMLRKELVA